MLLTNLIQLTEDSFTLLFFPAPVTSLLGALYQMGMWKKKTLID